MRVSRRAMLPVIALSSVCCSGIGGNRDLGRGEGRADALSGLSLRDDPGLSPAALSGLSRRDDPGLSAAALSVLSRPQEAVFCRAAALYGHSTGNDAGLIWAAACSSRYVRNDGG